MMRIGLSIVLKTEKLKSHNARGIITINKNQNGRTYVPYCAWYVRKYLFFCGDDETMTFQELNHADIPQLFELIQRYKCAIGESNLNETQHEKLKSAITQKKIEFFVAKQGDELIAMCSVSLVFSTFLCESGSIFEDFYIIEKYRGKGVARGLTQHVFNVLKSRGVVSAWVGCADIDVEMYKSLGFTMPLGNLLTWSCDE